MSEPLGRWVVFMRTKRGECMRNGMIVEVVGNMLGPLSKGVFEGLAGVCEKGCPVWYEVFECGDNLAEGGEESVGE